VVGPVKSPARPNRALSVTWLGTAGFLVGDGRDSFYIDPYVSRYSLFRIIAGLPLPPRVDLVRRWIGLTGGASAKAVVVSHSHFDHALDAPFFAGETGAVLVGSESAANVGRGAGLDERSIKSVRPGDAFRVGAFTIRFVESVHGFGLFGRTPYPGTIEKPLSPPAPATAYRLGTVFSLVIEHPLGRLVHHGSAGHFSGMFGELRADVMLLCIAGRGKTAAYLENTAIACRAKTVIPAHFDDFFRPLDAQTRHLPMVRIKEFVRTVGALCPDTRVVVPEAGRAIALT
jgi:L-ascorbate metabolism protein UlaG (beta-lactamase superfamily)